MSQSITDKLAALSQPPLRCNACKLLSRIEDKAERETVAAYLNDPDTPKEPLGRLLTGHYSFTVGKDSIQSHRDQGHTG